MVIRIVILAIGLMLWFDSLAYNQGDVIFQQSQSSQSEFIAEVTNSEWTHCGVIYIKDNKEYVLEASNVVKLTSIKEWIQKGKNSKYLVKKVPIKNFEFDLNKYLGKKYDLQFDWSDKQMYCSKLVYKVYLDNNIQICKLRKGSSYKLSEKLRQYAKKRGINLNSLMVAPSDLL